MWCKRVLFLYTLILFVDGKRFDTRCKLVRELIKVRIPNNIFLGQWVCLIEQVSQRDTSKYTESPSGKKFYGLFQIPSRWCNEGTRRGLCDVDCKALLDDDIQDDALCASQIFKQEGFKFWTQWQNRCKNNNYYTVEIYKCPDLKFPRTGRNAMFTSLRSKRAGALNSVHTIRLFRYMNVFK